MKVPSKAWIVVGDGARALFLENRGSAMNPDFQVLRKLENENPSSQEQGADRPGRYSSGTHRSAVEETDWHQLGEDRFAHEIADILYARAHRGDFEHLVIVAPPRVLGELRQTLHAEVTARIVGTMDKTLTGHPVGEIEKLVADF